MTRVPRSLARRLDRLSRRAHRFHRFAHHPLCGAYRAELIALGKKTRICRGCSFAVLGATLGLLAGLGLGRHARAFGGYAFALGCGVALVAAAAGIFGSLRPATAAAAPRPSKLTTRGAPLFSIGAVFGAGLVCSDTLGLALAVCAAVVTLGGYLRYGRRGPDRRACDRCPERSALGRCSGFAPILLRERAFARVARRSLAETHC